MLSGLKIIFTGCMCSNLNNSIQSWLLTIAHIIMINCKYTLCYVASYERRWHHNTCRRAQNILGKATCRAPSTTCYQFAIPTLPTRTHLIVECCRNMVSA